MLFVAMETNAPQGHSPGDILIIGGSLTGLTFALACAARGVSTRVLEQTPESYQRGSALGVDRALLLRVTGYHFNAPKDQASFPVVTEGRKAVSWSILHAWLRAQASQTPEITFLQGCTALAVGQSVSAATVTTSRNELLSAPVIVGADGYRSVVRRAINPDSPNARYAGYLLWRGLVCEHDLPSNSWCPASNNGVALINRNGHRLIAYPVANKNGSLTPGERLISFAWYDRSHGTLLREAGCVSPDGEVLASLRAESIPTQVQGELCGLARRLWPKPWSSVIIHAIERQLAFATPIAEYFPERLIRGRLAIIGDAAHVVSPATGQGFVAGIQDAEALAAALSRSSGDDGNLPAALQTYESQRLLEAQKLVSQSKEWSSTYRHNMGKPCSHLS